MTLLPPSSRLVVAAPLRVEAGALRRGAAGLRVVRTGMGPDRSERAALALRDDAAPAIAVAGLCGGLDSGLEPGDVIVASELRSPDGGLRRLDPDALYEGLAGLGLRVRVGPIQCTRRMVRGAERLSLADAGVRAVDMESWWLAAAAAGRPFGVVRVVVDTPRHELFRPASLRHGLHALGRLSTLAPGLRRWAAAVAPGTLAAAPAPREWHAAL